MVKLFALDCHSRVDHLQFSLSRLMPYFSDAHFAVHYNGGGKIDLPAAIRGRTGHVRLSY